MLEQLAWSMHRNQAAESIGSVLLREYGLDWIGTYHTGQARRWMDIALLIPMHSTYTAS